MKTLSFFIVMFTLLGLNEAIAQWNTSGNNIYNTNTGNVGIGNSSPTTMLHVAKNMTEPAITVQNLGGIGGATYSMIDNVSGANWKFKATNPLAALRSVTMPTVWMYSSLSRTVLPTHFTSRAGGMSGSAQTIPLPGCTWLKEMLS